MEENNIIEEDRIITIEEFARDFLRAFGDTLKMLQSGEPIKGNAHEIMATWDKWTEEE